VAGGGEREDGGTQKLGELNMVEGELKKLVGEFPRAAVIF